MFLQNFPSGLNVRSISLGAILAISVPLSKYDYLLTIIGLTISGITTIITWTSGNRPKTVLSCWLHLLHEICDLCIAAQGLSMLLDYMGGNKYNNYMHFVPTSTLPHLMPVTVILVVTCLFILGLEASMIFESLLKLFLMAAVILFLSTSVTLVQYPEKGVIHFHPDSFHMGLSAVAFFRSCFPGHRENVSKDFFLDHVAKLALYTIIIMTLYFVPQTKCTMLGLICPISHWYPWYEPTMVCICLSCLCVSLPQIYSAALSLLIAPGQLKLTVLTKENSTTGTHVRAISAIGVASIVLVYFNTMNALFLLKSGAMLLGHAFDSILYLSRVYQPYCIPNYPGMLFTSIKYHQPQNPEKETLTIISFLHLFMATLLDFVLLGVIAMEVILNLFIWIIIGTTSTYLLSRSQKSSVKRKPQIKLEMLPQPFIITNALTVQKNPEVRSIA